MNKKEIFNIIKTLDINNQIEINNIIKIFHEYKENEIRVKIIKKISSIKGNNYVEFFNYIVNGRYSEKVRKEATSGVGRRRDIEVAKKYLIEYLNDNNPEIQLQALRGLFVFKYDCFIKDEILKLYNKSNNEIIKYVISNEFKLNIIDFDTKESHIYVNPMYANKVIKGDSLKIMLGIQSNSIHLTFTSPPYYNARDYSIYSSYEEYLEFLTKIFDEVHRITKDGRFLIINTSPVIIPRVGRKYSSKRYAIAYDLHAKLTSRGWEFVDDIYWIKPDPSVKNRIGGFYQYRKPLMYKPNSVTEQIMVYRKKSNKLIDWNISCYPYQIVEDSKLNGEFDNNNIWKIDPVFDKVHSAVFPYKLCEKIVKYYSFKGDLIYDPFAGSGILGKAALDNDRKILLSEISNEYFNRIKEVLSDYKDIKYIY